MAIAVFVDRLPDYPEILRYRSLLEDLGALKGWE